MLWLQAMHYLDPDTFTGEGPSVSAEQVTELGNAFLPCLLNRCACYDMCTSGSRVLQCSLSREEAVLLCMTDSYECTVAAAIRWGWEMNVLSLPHEPS